MRTPTRVTRRWLGRVTLGVLSIDDVDLDDLRAFLLGRWRERAAEMGREPPADLSSSCMFSALFVKLAFGGRVRGNFDHVFNEVDGRRVDLNEDAADVLALSDPHRHCGVFVGSPGCVESLDSCLPRVTRWVDAYREELDLLPFPSVG